jgi:hypothetical protein
MKTKTINECFKNLKEGKGYYHCIDCGFLYLDKNWNIKLFNLNEIKGTHYLDKVIDIYNISSGLCTKCFGDIRRHNDKLEIEK